MTVRLIAVTKPVIPELESAEALVAYCARVSAPGNQSNFDTASKLIGYMLRKQHWSPFEMVGATIEIVATRDISRQILRHKSFVFQEFSQRYARVHDFSEPRECRLQDATNRQSSIPSTQPGLCDWWEDAQQRVTELAREVYDGALDRGIAREQARVVLPEGLTMSRLYMTGPLRSWIHYCALRTEDGTQKEHRAIAAACRDIVGEQFPAVAAALGWPNTTTKGE